MKWYRFWKDVGGRISAEHYRYYDDNVDEDDVECDVEDWVDRVNTAGMSRGYSYDFEVVKHPPKDWLENNICAKEQSIKHLNEIIDVYASTLKK